ncbi:hypothetical protein [Sodalinema gerasimenkoae]|uniref:hypothetical protein n=1 Tax=Sodalinema gerasimenkoae TaxID=2862348 RepID=UPI0013590F31|nr:hypothetical protein [Sodalinema gerasimenkoae]
MIYYLVTREYSQTINLYLEGKGSCFARDVTPIYYEELKTKKRLPAGVYIFSDIERLSPEQAQYVSWIWEDIKQSSSGSLVLNHPTRSLRRYELLRSLYERSINKFNIYRLTECRVPSRFPVFLRGENDHRGNTTGLLKDAHELEQALEMMKVNGDYRDDCVMTEFCDTRDSQGVFRKYSAFKVGDRIIPFHVLFHNSWMIKGGKLYDSCHAEEEKIYVETNPHEEQLREIFELADIQYGRIDYSLLDGVLQVWEINTNPHIRPCQFEQGWKNLEAAFTALQSSTSSKQTIRLSLPDKLAKLPYDKEIIDRIMDGFRWLPNDYRVSLSRSLRNFKKTLKKL